MIAIEVTLLHANNMFARLCHDGFGGMILLCWHLSSRERTYSYLPRSGPYHKRPATARSRDGPP